MRLLSLCVSAALGLAASGCFAVTDLGRFDQSAAGAGGSAASNDPTQYRDLRFVLQGMKPHAKHYFYYRIVSDQNVVVGEGALDPFGPSTQGPNDDPLDTLIEVTHLIPKEGNPHLDFYADVNGSGDYDGFGDIATQDHSWRIDTLDQVGGFVTGVTDDAVEITFKHNTEFSDIDQGGAPRLVGRDARVTLANPGAFYDRVVEVRVIDRDNQHTVGMERFTALDASQTLATIAGMIDPGVDYDIEVYADRNGDHIYQDTGTPDGDSGWRVPVTATDDGIDVTIDLSTGSQPAARVDYAFP